MAKSLKANYLFNLANTISGLLFPLITFPYASRILLADGIGQINFSNPLSNTLRCLRAWEYLCMP